VENSKLLSDAPNDGSRDENTAFYLAKIEELEKKFKEFIEESPAISPSSEDENPLGLEFH
jgi:hypothetical protein